MFGYLILVVATTIIGYILYANVEASRKKNYLETHTISNEQRAELEKDDFHNRMIIIIRLVIWLACVASGFFGNILGIVLSAIFSAEALFHIYKEAFSAGKSRVSSLTMLAIPFGGFLAALGYKYAGIIVGILLGILTITMVQISAYAGRQIREEGE